MTLELDITWLIEEILSVGTWCAVMGEQEEDVWGER